MKSILIILSVTLSCNFSIATDTLVSTISKATVFLSGAQVFRSTPAVAIKKGVNEMIIKDVSPNLNQQHIQATAKGQFMILDVQYITEYIAPNSIQPTIIPEKIQKEINWLNDTILFISFEKERISSKLENLHAEKKMILENQLIKGGGISDTLPEFKQIITFYRQKLDEINELIQQWKIQQYSANTRENKHRSRLNELNNFSRNIGQPTEIARTRYHIVVTTYAEFSTTGKIEVNYLVPNAGWIPAYDLRADNTSDPMTITYKARVFQSSGEDWDNIDLVLSTYNQNCFTTKPTMGIWRLDYTINKPGKPQEAMFFSQNFASQTELESAETGYRQQALKDNNEFNSNSQFLAVQNMADINQNFSNVEFDVKLPYSIKADGSQKLMVITNEKVQAEYYHYLLPRVNKDAFLLAKISDWENLSLLPGPANIYFNQTIVGSTTLNPSVMSDTMEVTLGRDQGIISTRKKTDEQLKRVGLGKRDLKILSFEIEIKNTSKTEVNLTVEDLIPITINEEIEIKLLEGNGAQFNEETGRLTWELKLKPAEKKVIKFTYSVEHDKDKPVS